MLSVHTTQRTIALHFYAIQNVLSDLVRQAFNERTSYDILHTELAQPDTHTSTSTIHEHAIQVASTTSHETDDQTAHIVFIPFHFPDDRPESTAEIRGGINETVDVRVERRHVVETVPEIEVFNTIPLRAESDGRPATSVRASRLNVPEPQLFTVTVEESVTMGQSPRGPSPVSGLAGEIIRRVEETFRKAGETFQSVGFAAFHRSKPEAEGQPLAKQPSGPKISEMFEGESCSSDANDSVPIISLPDDDGTTGQTPVREKSRERYIPIHLEDQPGKVILPQEPAKSSVSIEEMETVYPDEAPSPATETKISDGEQSNESASVKVDRVPWLVQPLDDQENVVNEYDVSSVSPGEAHRRTSVIVCKDESILVEEETSPIREVMMSRATVKVTPRLKRASETEQDTQEARVEMAQDARASLETKKQSRAGGKVMAEALSDVESGPEDLDAKDAAEHAQLIGGPADVTEDTLSGERTEVSLILSKKKTRKTIVPKAEETGVEIDAAQRITPIKVKTQASVSPRNESPSTSTTNQTSSVQLLNAPTDEENADFIEDTLPERTEMKPKRKTKKTSLTEDTGVKSDVINSTETETLTAVPSTETAEESTVELFPITSAAEETVTSQALPDEKTEVRITLNKKRPKKTKIPQEETGIQVDTALARAAEEITTETAVPSHQDGPSEVAALDIPTASTAVVNPATEEVALPEKKTEPRFTTPEIKTKSEISRADDTETHEVVSVQGIALEKIELATAVPSHHDGPSEVAAVESLIILKAGVNPPMTEDTLSGETTGTKSSTAKKTAKNVKIPQEDVEVQIITAQPIVANAPELQTAFPSHDNTSSEMVVVDALLHSTTGENTPAVEETIAEEKTEMKATKKRPKKTKIPLEEDSEVQEVTAQPIAPSVIQLQNVVPPQVEGPSHIFSVQVPIEVEYPIAATTEVTPLKPRMKPPSPAEPGTGPFEEIPLSQVAKEKTKRKALPKAEPTKFEVEKVQLKPIPRKSEPDDDVRQGIETKECSSGDILKLSDKAPQELLDLEHRPEIAELSTEELPHVPKKPRQKQKRHVKETISKESQSVEEPDVPLLIEGPVEANSTWRTGENDEVLEAIRVRKTKIEPVHPSPSDVPSPALPSDKFSVPSAAPLAEIEQDIIPSDQKSQLIVTPKKKGRTKKENKDLPASVQQVPSSPDVPALIEGPFEAKLIWSTGKDVEAQDSKPVEQKTSISTKKRSKLPSEQTLHVSFSPETAEPFETNLEKVLPQEVEVAHLKTATTSKPTILQSSLERIESDIIQTREQNDVVAEQSIEAILPLPKSKRTKKVQRKQEANDTEAEVSIKLGERESPVSQSSVDTPEEDVSTSVVIHLASIEHFEREELGALNAQEPAETATVKILGEPRESSGITGTTDSEIGEKAPCETVVGSTPSTVDDSAATDEISKRVTLKKRKKTPADKCDKKEIEQSPSDSLPQVDKSEISSVSGLKEHLEIQTNDDVPIALEQSVRTQEQQILDASPSVQRLEVKTNEVVPEQQVNESDAAPWRIARKHLTRSREANPAIPEQEKTTLDVPRASRQPKRRQERPKEKETQSIQKHVNDILVDQPLPLPVPPAPEHDTQSTSEMIGHQGGPHGEDVAKASIRTFTSNDVIVPSATPSSAVSDVNVVAVPEVDVRDVEPAEAAPERAETTEERKPDEPTPVTRYDVTLDAKQQKTKKKQVIPEAEVFVKQQIKKKYPMVVDVVRRVDAPEKPETKFVTAKEINSVEIPQGMTSQVEQPETEDLQEAAQTLKKKKPVNKREASTFEVEKVTLKPVPKRSTVSEIKAPEELKAEVSLAPSPLQLPEVELPEKSEVELQIRQKEKKKTKVLPSASEEVREPSQVTVPHDTTHAELSRAEEASESAPKLKKAKPTKREATTFEVEKVTLKPIPKKITESEPQAPEAVKAELSLVPVAFSSSDEETPEKSKAELQIRQKKSKKSKQEKPQLAEVTPMLESSPLKVQQTSPKQMEHSTVEDLQSVTLKKAKSSAKKEESFEMEKVTLKPIPKKTSESVKAPEAVKAELSVATAEFPSPDEELPEKGKLDVKMKQKKPKKMNTESHQTAEVTPMLEPCIKTVQYDSPKQVEQSTVEDMQEAVVTLKKTKPTKREASTFEVEKVTLKPIPKRASVSEDKPLEELKAELSVAPVDFKAPDEEAPEKSEVNINIKPKKTKKTKTREEQLESEMPAPETLHTTTVELGKVKRHTVKKIETAEDIAAIPRQEKQPIDQHITVEQRKKEKIEKVEDEITPSYKTEAELTEVTPVKKDQSFKKKVSFELPEPDKTEEKEQPNEPVELQEEQHIDIQLKKKTKKAKKVIDSKKESTEQQMDVSVKTEATLKHKKPEQVMETLEKSEVEIGPQTTVLLESTEKEEPQTTEVKLSIKETESPSKPAALETSQFPTIELQRPQARKITVEAPEQPELTQQPQEITQQFTIQATSMKKQPEEQANVVETFDITLGAKTEATIQPTEAKSEATISIKKKKTKKTEAKLPDVKPVTQSEVTSPELEQVMTGEAKPVQLERAQLKQRPREATVVQETVILDSSNNISPAEPVVTARAQHSIRQETVTIAPYTEAQTARLPDYEAPGSARAASSSTVRQAVTVVESISNEQPDWTGQVKTPGEKARIKLELKEAVAVTHVSTEDRPERLGPVKQAGSVTVQPRMDVREGILCQEVVPIPAAPVEAAQHKKPETASATFQFVSNYPIETSQMQQFTKPEKFMPELFVATEKALPRISTETALITTEMRAPETEGTFVSGRLPPVQQANVALSLRESATIVQQSTHEKESAMRPAERDFTEAQPLLEASNVTVALVSQAQTHQSAQDFARQPVEAGKRGVLSVVPHETAVKEQPMLIETEVSGVPRLPSAQLEQIEPVLVTSKAVSVKTQVPCQSAEVLEQVALIPTGKTAHQVQDSMDAATSFQVVTVESAGEVADSTAPVSQEATASCVTLESVSTTQKLTYDVESDWSETAQLPAVPAPKPTVEAFACAVQTAPILGQKEAGLTMTVLPETTTASTRLESYMTAPKVAHVNILQAGDAFVHVIPQSEVPKVITATGQSVPTVEKPMIQESTSQLKPKIQPERKMATSIVDEAPVSLETSVTFAHESLGETSAHAPTTDQARVSFQLHPVVAVQTVVPSSAFDRLEQSTPLSQSAKSDIVPLQPIADSLEVALHEREGQSQSVQSVASVRASVSVLPMEGSVTEFTLASVKEQALPSFSPQQDVASFTVNISKGHVPVTSQVGSEETVASYSVPAVHKPQQLSVQHETHQSVRVSVQHPVERETDLSSAEAVPKAQTITHTAHLVASASAVTSQVTAEHMPDTLAPSEDTPQSGRLVPVAVSLLPLTLTETAPGESVAPIAQATIESAKAAVDLGQHGSVIVFQSQLIERESPGARFVAPRAQSATVELTPKEAVLTGTQLQVQHSDDYQITRPTAVSLPAKVVSSHEGRTAQVTVVQTTSVAGQLETPSVAHETATFSVSSMETAEVSQIWDYRREDQWVPLKQQSVAKTAQSVTPSELKSVQIEETRAVEAAGQFNVQRAAPVESVASVTSLLETPSLYAPQVLQAEEPLDDFVAAQWQTARPVAPSEQKTVQISQVETHLREGPLSIEQPLAQTAKTSVPANEVAVQRQEIVMDDILPQETKPVETALPTISFTEQKALSVAHVTESTAPSGLVVPVRPEEKTAVSVLDENLVTGVTHVQVAFKEAPLDETEPLPIQTAHRVPEQLRTVQVSQVQVAQREAPLEIQQTTGKFAQPRQSISEAAVVEQATVVDLPAPKDVQVQQQSASVSVVEHKAVGVVQVVESANESELKPETKKSKKAKKVLPEKIETTVHDVQVAFKEAPLQEPAPTQLKTAKAVADEMRTVQISQVQPEMKEKPLEIVEPVPKRAVATVPETETVVVTQELVMDTTRPQVPVEVVSEKPVVSVTEQRAVSVAQIVEATAETQLVPETKKKSKRASKILPERAETTISNVQVAYKEAPLDDFVPAAQQVASVTSEEKQTVQVTQVVSELKEAPLSVEKPRVKSAKVDVQELVAPVSVEHVVLDQSVPAVDQTSVPEETASVVLPEKKALAVSTVVDASNEAELAPLTKPKEKKAKRVLPEQAQTTVTQTEAAISEKPLDIRQPEHQTAKVNLPGRSSAVIKTEAVVLESVKDETPELEKPKKTAQVSVTEQKAVAVQSKVEEAISESVFTDSMPVTHTATEAVTESAKVATIEQPTVEEEISASEDSFHSLHSSTSTLVDDTMMTAASSLEDMIVELEQLPEVPEVFEEPVQAPIVAVKLEEAETSIKTETEVSLKTKKKKKTVKAVDDQQSVTLPTQKVEETEQQFTIKSAVKLQPEEESVAVFKLQTQPEEPEDVEEVAVFTQKKPYKVEEVEEEQFTLKPTKKKAPVEDVASQATLKLKQQEPEQEDVEESFQIGLKPKPTVEETEQQITLKPKKKKKSFQQDSAETVIRLAPEPQAAETQVVQSVETAFVAKSQPVARPYKVEELDEEQVQIKQKKTEERQVESTASLKLKEAEKEQQEIEETFEIGLKPKAKKTEEVEGETVSVKKKRKSTVPKTEAASDALTIRKEDDSVLESSIVLEESEASKVTDSGISITDVRRSEEASEDVSAEFSVKNAVTKTTEQEESVRVKIPAKPKATAPVFREDSAYLTVKQAKEVTGTLPDEETTGHLEVKEGDQMFALCSFVSDTKEAMNLVEGERVYILESHNSDWWFVRKHLTEETGWVPAQFLQDDVSYTHYVNKKLDEKINKLPVFDLPGEGTKAQAPRFITKLQSVNVPDGGSVTFECKVEGHPRPVITWFRQTACIKQSQDFMMVYDDETNMASLTIAEVFPEDAGTFTCVAKNAAGFSSSSAELVVEAPLSDHGSESTLTSRRSLSRESSLMDILEGIPPTFSQRPRTKAVEEGTDVELECRLVAVPEPEVVWFHNGKRIKNTERIAILSESDVHMYCSIIQIKDVRKEDEGTYDIIARNREGEAINHVILNVKVKEIKKIPPVVEHPLTNRQVQEGHSVVFTARITGFPMPEVKWFRNGSEVAPGPNFVIQQAKNGDCTLTVRSADSRDAGEYVLRGVNEHGTVETKCELTVSPVPEPLRFTEKFGDSTVAEGAELNLKVVLSSPAEVAWYRNGKRLKTTKTLVISDSDQIEHFLHVTSSQIDKETGEYKCVASNATGQKITHTAQVKVEANIFVQHLKDTVIELNKDVELKCTTKEPTDVKWFRNDVQLKTSARQEIMQSSDKREHVLVLHSAGRGETGRYSCTFANQTTACVLSVRAEPAPEFVTKIRDTEIKERQQVVFEAEVSTDAALVTWHKDGEPIKEDATGRYAFVSDGRRRQLVIKSVSLHDEGEYTCSLGEHECTAELTVIELPPEITLQLKDVTVKRGEEATFEIELTKGDAKIQWFRDEEEVELSEHIQLAIDGKRQRLVIVDCGPDDAKQYTCRIGEQRSSARLTVLAPDVDFTARLPEVTTATMGQDVTFTVVLSKEADVWWIKNGEAVAESDRIKSEYFHSLQLPGPRNEIP